MKTALHRAENETGNALVCEYVRNEEVLRLTLPASISPEDLSSKVELLIREILTRGHEKEALVETEVSEDAPCWMRKQ